MQIHSARPSEYDAIYQMGFDTWGDGQPLEVYLDGCRSSPKYQQGSWYVLKNEHGVICSSLIRYRLGERTCGIGSIATPPQLRKKGFASALVAAALKQFEGEGFQRVFLFSDIDPKFYERFGFIPLPLRFQHYKDSVCMILGASEEQIERSPDFVPPKYF